MPREWEAALERWQNAGLVDAETAARIREFEKTNATPLRWPVMVALVFGGLMLGAGVLLFIAAHWDILSPAERFAVALAMVAVFHAGGAWASRSNEGLAIALHGIGTAALGAGIFLAGQIFNLAGNWPAGVMLWAAGAWIGFALRRDWLQFAFAAVLTPLWLGGEWTNAFPSETPAQLRVLLDGNVLAAITYFTAGTRGADGARRQTLMWIGGIALLPCSIFLASEAEIWNRRGTSDTTLEWIGYAVAFALPLALAWFLRGREAWMNLIAAAWVGVLGMIASTPGAGVYAWCALGAAGMIAWGVQEGRDERVNMGMAGFALTLLFFYFSQVMDKLGRSASLVGLGVLFLAGGWALERMRRRWVAQAREAR